MNAAAPLRSRARGIIGGAADSEVGFVVIVGPHASDPAEVGAAHVALERTHLVTRRVNADEGAP